MSELCKYRSLRINLIVLVFVQMLTTLSVYQLQFFLKYLQGDIYYNTYAYAIAGMVGSIGGGSVLACLGLRKLFLYGFILASIGSLLLSIFSQSEGKDNLTAAMLFVTIFGFAMGFLGCYMSSVLLFPTVLKSSAMGFYNFFARIGGIIAPFVAELE